MDCKMIRPGRWGPSWRKWVPVGLSLKGISLAQPLPACLSISISNCHEPSHQTPPPCPPCPWVFCSARDQKWSQVTVDRDLWNRELKCVVPPFKLFLSDVLSLGGEAVRMPHNENSLPSKLQFTTRETCLSWRGFVQWAEFFHFTRWKGFGDRGGDSSVMLRMRDWYH